MAPPARCGGWNWSGWPAPTCSASSTSPRSAPRCPTRPRRRWPPRSRWPPARSRSSCCGPAAGRCGSRSSRWAGSAATSSATAATPTSCSSTRHAPAAPTEAEARPRSARRRRDDAPAARRARPRTRRCVLDSGLRPEGRQGPLTRSLASYAAYYRRWSLGWEAQALLRARPDRGRRRARACGSLELADDGPLPDHAAARGGRARSLGSGADGARADAPKGVDRTLHLKLGPGGLTDVEWAAQLLQLQYGARVPGLRTTSTLDALAAAAGGRAA